MESYAHTMESLAPMKLADFMSQNSDFVDTVGLSDDIASALPKFMTGAS